MNGSVAVDIWGQSSLPGCYAIGKTAGTHRVTRPGGAGLNAGQVFGVRCAQHIRASIKTRTGRIMSHDAIAESIAWLKRGLLLEEVSRNIQVRMSDTAGFIYYPDKIETAAAEALALNRSRDQADP